MNPQSDTGLCLECSLVELADEEYQMSDVSQGPGWWMASDGKWYPPESAPGYVAPTGQSAGQVPGITPNFPTNPGVTYIAVATDPLGRAYAGWWTRVGATMIDFLILVIFQYAVTAAIRGGIGSLLALAVSITYQAVMIATKGGTVGNMALGTIVVDVKTGAAASQGKAWGRSAMDAVFQAGAFLFGIPTLLDILWPLWDKQKQTLHDKAAGTAVVKKA